ncbi:Transcriptional regulator [Hoeflea phototrophica DFL-43]|uniref:Transcriptional regulator n=1 Tax=Hoeflea phototrophica (strain DSM 17068 / NCIMB 14078 / DFL-43) TaxID=411684 RepID=A9D906_HOEPD|nr:MarR family transcriptional regulator [Hoeflea phototrophica]EDQ32825.1 Transcriptional regulator [Hoeflea phototrophica DFL-43]
MQDKQSSFGQTISHLARAYTTSLNARLQPLGLSQARYQVLSVLEADGEQTQRDLARRLGVEQATMANTLTRMTRDGLIVRKPHPDDGRAQLVALTQAARDLVAPAHQATKEADESLLENLPAAEHALFLSMLERLSNAITPGGSTQETQRD